jgi:hypothetical protein
MKTYGGVEVYVHNFFNSALDGGECSASRPGRFTPEIESTLPITCRPQWPRSLRLEMPSLARTLGSWVRIPLKAWMSVFILCLC